MPRARYLSNPRLEVPGSRRRSWFRVACQILGSMCVDSCCVFLHFSVFLYYSPSPQEWEGYTNQAYPLINSKRNIRPSFHQPKRKTRSTRRLALWPRGLRKATTIFNLSYTDAAQMVKNPRAVTRNAVSFCVERSRLGLSKLRLTSANNLLSASFSLAWFSGVCVDSKWCLYASKLDSLASIKLSMGRMTAQWFCGGPNNNKLNKKKHLRLQKKSNFD